MIVDDNPANLKVLEEILSHQGHAVRSFPRGRLALAPALHSPPDLILLDINMPEMNGYEVCERLKSADHPQLANVPVIFLSAMTATEDKVKAFRSGAVDYISKPFQFEEVQARVETHLKLHNLRLALGRHNELLEEMVAARTRELAEANERLMVLDRSKGDFLQLISHEFRTPLNGLLGVGELILDGMHPTEENDELRSLFARSRSRILSLLDDALLLTHVDLRRDMFRLGPTPLSAVLQRAMESTLDSARFANVTIECPSASPRIVLADASLLTRAMHGLLEISVKFSTPGTAVRLSFDESADFWKVVINVHGWTIPSSALARFFDPFAIAEALTPGGELGLRAPMASRILKLFGGSVDVANRDESGIRLTVCLRRAVTASAL
ncbi:MAG: hybrid sensor histidine kinase/response regulator [Acidobacteria bacterium]|nr:hybrid sensor histidine kinase/response regulator [Acidobacteriota bacterium]